VSNDLSSCITMSDVMHGIKRLNTIVTF